MSPAFHQLAGLLRKRLEVIGDHAWRDRDADTHLAALVEVGEAVEAWKSLNLPACDPRLRHFLEGCSYEKALAWISEKNP